MAYSQFIFHQLGHMWIGTRISVPVTSCNQGNHPTYQMKILEAHLSSEEKNPHRSFIIVVFLKMFAVMRKDFVFMLLGCQLK